MTDDHAARDRYISLLQRCLTRELFLDEETHDVARAEFADVISDDLRSVMRTNGWRITRSGGDAVKRDDGNDWPPSAETMVGRKRLANVRACVESVLADEIPGDLIETGVWRGGVTILMRGILAAWGDTHRRVWVADSFQGLPVPDVEAFPADEGHDLSGVSALAVSSEQVKANFARYDLLDDQLQFLEGWFKDTLPTAPVEQLAVLRLDGDLYESTMDALDALYPKLSVGGYVIIDDYGAWEPCRAAVDEYRHTHAITDEIIEVDWAGIYWRCT